MRGHNLGLYPDETPHILEDVDYVLKQDMVVIAHPNTYLPLSGYMVFGDTLLITETGNMRLNKTEKEVVRQMKARTHHLGQGGAAALRIRSTAGKSSRRAG